MKPFHSIAGSILRILRRLHPWRMRVVIGAVSIVALVFLALPVMALWTGVVLLIIAAVSLSLMRWLARVVGDADPMAEA